MTLTSIQLIGSEYSSFSHEVFYGSGLDLGILLDHFGLIKLVGV